MKKFWQKTLGQESNRLCSEFAEDELGRVLILSQFSQEQIFSLYEDFREVSARLSPLDAHQFQQVIEKIGLAKQIGYLARQRIRCSGDPPVEIQLSESSVIRDTIKSLFVIFDTKGDNRIDFGEFLLGISLIVYGTTTQKAMGIFRLYDNNGDGIISREDLYVTLCKILKSAKKVASASTRHLREQIGKERLQTVTKTIDSIDEDRGIYLMVDEMFSEMDLEKRGHITKEDFILYVESHPLTLQMLQQLSDNFDVIIKPSKMQKTSSIEKL